MRSLVVALALIFAACHRDEAPKHPNPADLPPLPPASGTPIGYLIDASADLKLSDEQLTKLKEIDQKLAASDAEIDTQLRQIEKPEEEEPISPAQRKAGMKQPRHNNAPGASGKPTGDAAKLHAIRDRQDRDALNRAWAILDAIQQGTAKKILEDRGVEVPGAPKKQQETSEDGQPLPGMEP